MNNLPPSSKDVWLIAFLYISIAVLQHITSSDVWAGMIGKQWIAILTTLSTGFLAWRAFLDKSVARKKMDEETPVEPVQVAVQSSEANPVIVAPADDPKPDA